MMKTKHTELIFVGIAFVIFSYFINCLYSIFLSYYSTAHYDDVFFFPGAFAIAALYGWWSKNYFYGFLVGFCSIPMIVTPFPPYFMPVIFITDLLELTDYNLVTIAIFSVFGVVSGLIGMGFVKLHKIGLKTM